MLTYSLEAHSEENLYEQLYDFIKRDILHGELPGKARLPSKREFARHLGVSTITVENAYAKLADEGYIFSQPKKGFFVSDITVDSCLRPVPGQTEDATYYIEENETPPREDFLDLSASYTLPSLFPFATWSRLVRRVPVVLDEQGMSLEGLRESGATIAHISPSHHFPTGRVMSISRRYELLGWAAKAEGRYIIEDDYDAEFRLKGRPLPTLRGIDSIGRVIYLNTFTKSLSPTIRISYMVLPESLMALFREKLGFYACTVPNINQYTLAAFMRDGHFENHISHLRRYYREQRDYALAELKKHDSLRDAEVMEADAGLYFLLRLPTDKADFQLKAAAGQEKLSLSFLSDYYTRREAAPEHVVIVNYASLPRDALARALAVLAGCI